MKDIVDIIVAKTDIDAGTKLVRLYSAVMLNYRQPLGDKAWDEIAKMFKDPKAITGFSFLMGFMMAGAKTERYAEFIKDELQEVENVKH